MALLLRKRLILIEKEGDDGSDYGNDPGMDNATDAVLVRDLSITPQQSDVVSRDLIRPYLGASEQLLANTRVECTFSVELAGSGTAGTAPRYHNALEACGLEEDDQASSVTYTPESSGFSSITIHYNVDGVLHKVTGCRGSFALTANVGEIPSIDFTFTGIYVPPIDFALPSVTYADQATPLIFKNGNTTNFTFLGNSALSLQSVNFEVGNTTVYRELIGGSKEVLITDRAATGTLVIEAEPMSTSVRGGSNLFAASLIDTGLGTNTNLTFQHGTTAGNIVTFTSTRVDLGDLTYSDQDGIAMLNIPYTAIPSTSGNDEFTLVYT